MPRKLMLLLLRLNEIGVGCLRVNHVIIYLGYEWLCNNVFLQKFLHTIKLFHLMSQFYKMNRSGGNRHTSVPTIHFVFAVFIPLDFTFGF